MDTFCYELVSTRFGVLGIVWSTHGTVSRILLWSSPRSIVSRVKLSFPDSRERRGAHSSRLARRIIQYVNGIRVTFDPRVLDTSVLYPFQSRVLQAEYTIPYGSVCTYGMLAQRIKCPGAARAVGTALARNPFPIVIPCHRTIKADGSPGGYRGGTAMKRRLLELEGVRFSKKGKVLSEYFV